MAGRSSVTDSFVLIQMLYEKQLDKVPHFRGSLV